MTANQHIIDYLSFYSKFPQPPGFAVMLNGRWGIGKTFLLKKFLDRIRTSDFKPVYVSLNGLTSSGEIDKALFKSMHAVLGNKFFGAAVGLGKSGLKALKGVSIDVDLLDLVNRYTADLYVFDDLERCEMKIGEILGYINAFVEHGGRKVVIVANEAEIGEDEDEVEAYGRTREKLIGMTLAFQSAIGDALAAFLQSVRDPAARDFLTGKVELIKTIHGQAALDNLRVLQQALWDFERFYAALENRHRADAAAMTAMLRLLLALSMEVRAGRLGEAELRDRKSALVRALIGREKGLPSRFMEARARYGSSDLDSRALSDETLVALLINGSVDVAAIRRDLDASTYFVVVAQEPPWRTVWYGLERTDAEVAAAQVQMEAAFAARAYTVPGEILHVFGLRLQLSQIGALSIAVQNVVMECERYVDDLNARKQLEPATVDDGSSELRATGYGGLGIVLAETPEFQALFAYLGSKRALAAADGYPAIADTLIETLRTDPERFVDELAQGAGNSSRYARIPVLARIDPNAFVTALVSLRPETQRQVLRSLKVRFEHGSLAGELAQELPWAQLVHRRLEAEMVGMSPYGRYRMEMFIRQSFGSVRELASAVPPLGGEAEEV